MGSHIDEYSCIWDCNSDDLECNMSALPVTTGFESIAVQYGWQSNDVVLLMWAIHSHTMTVVVAIVVTFDSRLQNLMRIGVVDLVDFPNDVAKDSTIWDMPSHGFEYLRSESQGF